MCGILAVHGLEKPVNDRTRFIALSKRLRHRGPDWSGCFVGQRSILAHERLAIVGVGSCATLISFLPSLIIFVMQTPVLSLLSATTEKSFSLSTARFTTTSPYAHPLVQERNLRLTRIVKSLSPWYVFHSSRLDPSPHDP